DPRHVPRFRRGGARALCRPRHRPEPVAVRNPLRLPTQPLPARAPTGARHRASLHPATAAAEQRQGRALPADAQTRAGPRPRLPLKQPPCQSTVTLARLLQQAQTTQLTRRPAPDQTCPQPPEAGHLGAPGANPLPHNFRPRAPFGRINGEPTPLRTTHVREGSTPERSTLRRCAFFGRRKPQALTLMARPVWWS